MAAQSGGLEMNRKKVIVLFIVLLFAVCTNAADYGGSFVSRTPDGDILLDLEQDADGGITGQLGDQFEKLRIEGAVGDGEIRGDAFQSDGEQLGFTARMNAEGDLWMRLFPVFDGLYAEELAETIVFVPAAPATQVAGDIVVNRVPLSGAEVQAIRERYGVPIQEGRYWYDAACGAWGIEGGPTAGFIMAGMRLPGPMPVDASQGGTNIFINGREIHPLDQAALQQIFGYTVHGRYWLDARGNLGPEGGEAITNLAAAIQASQQSGGGGGESTTHGYPSAGGARGTVAGGMYSGRTATGKSVLWFPGM